MKRPPEARRERPASPQQPRRVWRVFEYRRPPLLARPRFTT
ncbi:MAG: hypothetical protein ACJ75D_09710 [Gaiellaceae bacterium]